MQVRRIIRIVDALGSQGRVIVHLNCKHNISITAHEWEGNSTHPSPIVVDSTYLCPFCADPPPLPPEEKSAVQLWKEAGEP